jgi:hypothetical protein
VRHLICGKLKRSGAYKSTFTLLSLWYCAHIIARNESDAPADPYREWTKLINGKKFLVGAAAKHLSILLDLDEFRDRCGESLRRLAHRRVGEKARTSCKFARESTAWLG